MRLAKFFLENSKFTSVLTLFVFIFGLGGLITLNRESFPNVNIGAVIITTEYDGASAKDIETKITKPIEDRIRLVSGLKDVRSVSKSGKSRIVTQVDIDNYDVEEVIADLQREVDRVSDLPPDLENPPSFLEIKSEEFPVIELAVLGPNDQRQRDKIADQLKEELEDNNKISNIRLSGFVERQFNVLLDVDKMNQLHVGINEVLKALDRRNITIPAGKIEKQDDQQLIRIEGKTSNTEEVKDIIIRSNYSSTVVLGDVAEIQDGKEDAKRLGSYNGKAATFITINKKAGTDILELAVEVDDVIDIFRSKYKDEFSFHIYNHEGDRVSNRINVLTSNAILGLILVIVFLMTFLPGRIGAMASLSLPLSVLFTIGLMQSLGFSLNTITILAFTISIGMLVDNSVVISENFARLRELGLSIKDAALKSVGDLWIPISATAMTTIAAFLPMLVTSGVIGKFIMSIPIVVSISLLVSLGESFFLLPTRLTGFAKKAVKGEVKKEKKLNPINRWFTHKAQPAFSRLVAKVVRFRWPVLGIYLALFSLSIFAMVVGNKLILFPADQTEIYLARVEMPEGTRLEVTDQVSADVSRSIKAKLGDYAAHVISKSGVAENQPGDPKGKFGDNVSMIFIFMNDAGKNTLKTNDVLAQLREIKHEKTKRLSFEAQINGPPIGDPVTVTFRSNNAENLREVTKAVMADLHKTDGVLDVKVDEVMEDPEIFINLDYSKLAKAGLDLQTVGNSIRAAIAGRPIRDVNIDNHEVKYFVRLKDNNRKTISDIKRINVLSPRGNLIPLEKLAKIEQNQGSPQIKRFDFRRAKTVTASVNDDIITAYAANEIVRKKFTSIQEDYKDVSMVFGGEGENTQESMQSLTIALMMSLIGIFALLVLVFKSYLRPFIIMTTIPLGLVGFSVAFALHGRPISFLAMIGVIGLGGIIVNSGIVLISFIEKMRQETDLKLSEILVQSSTNRLRAVMVTSLTTISGLLPTAYGIGGIDEFIIPITLALAWGLTTGTILTLLWIPAAYAIQEDVLSFFTHLLKRKEAKTKWQSPIEIAPAKLVEHNN